MAELFGFKFERIKDTKSQEKFTVPPADDGTVEIAGGGFFGQVLDVDGRDKSELDLIRRYREISQQPECDSAIEDIVNEGIVSNERDQAVSIVLDRLKYPKSIKDKIRNEFDHVLSLLDFDVKGHDIFRRWYVDGRIFYHKVIDKKNPKKGIVEVRYIDPRKIRKVRQVNKNTKPGSSIDLVKSVEDYFIYNEKGLQQGQMNEGIKIADDSITYVPSGLIDMNRGHVLGYLHKAIKPVNQLRMIEDAVVIYRLSRAPERRIFYIDVGNLPKIKAEQYLKDVMNRYRNKLVYDASTGEIRDDRNHMSMLEDFWLPRREGGRGTEITRDELKFTKFVQRLRKKFTPLFTDMLKAQLILKGIITVEDWDRMKEHIQYNFLQDGHFAELKKAELMQDRINALQSIETYIGTFYSKGWVQRNVLNMTDAEIDEMQKEMNKEAGMDVEDGGVDMPDGGDGITRYPQDATGSFISPDDLEGKNDGVNNKGDENGGN